MQNLIDFYTQSTNLPLLIVAAAAAVLVLALCIAYMISRRVFTVWHEALFLQRTNRRMRTAPNVLNNERPFCGNLPSRIRRVWSVFTEDTRTSTFINVSDYVKIQNITGKSVDFGRGGFYLASAMLLAVIGSIVTAVICIMRGYDLLSCCFLTALPLLPLVLVFFARAIGRNAYKLLDEQCNAFCSLASLHIFCSPAVSVNETYSLLKTTDETIKAIEKAVGELPDVQQAVFTTKETVAAIAHVQANANADALERLTELYCDTMNERMNGQLARMGEIMQSTIDAQNAMRNSMLLLLNDIQATSRTLHCKETSAPQK